MDREARRIKEAKRNSPKGGIDFDDKYLNMNLEGEGVDFLIPAGFDWVLNTSILGLTPQILEIRSGVGIELSFFKPPYLFKNSI